MNPQTMVAACASTQRFVERLDRGQLTFPTPCDKWDVRSLLNHLIGTLSLGAALLSDTPPAHPISAGGLPEVDLVGDDVVAAYVTAMEDLLAASSDETWGRMLSTPSGEMPGVMLGGFTTLDIAVHGWDLAVATGQNRDLDDDLVAEVSAFAYRTLSGDGRGPVIAAPVPIAASASATDQLMAFLGRTP